MAESLYTPDLEVSSLFSRGWETFKQHLGFTIGVFLIYSLLTGSGNFYREEGLLFGVWQMIVFVITGPLTAGTYFVALRLVRGEEADLGEMFSGFRVFGRAFGVYVLYLLLVVIGIVFFVVPGLYLAVALAPAIFLVLDDHLPAVETLKKAWAMTKGYRGRIFVVALAVVGLNLLGLLALVIGIFFTGALSLLIWAALYDELARAYEAQIP